METRPHLAHALPPPVPIPIPQRRPAVERDAPVLPPLVGKGIRFKNPLRRTAAAPRVIENLRPRPHIRAVVVHAKRNVPHQRHAFFVRVFFHRRPLLPRQPLHIAAEAHPQLHRPPPPRRLLRQPGPRAHRRALLRRPPVPAFRAPVLLHQRAKKRVILQPVRLRAAKLPIPPQPHPVTPPRPREEILKRLRQQPLLQRLHRRILHRPDPQPFQPRPRRHRRDLLRAQVEQRRRRDLDRHRLQRHRGDRIVGRVIIARLIDRQELHHRQPLRRRPIHQLPQRSHIAHPQIILSPQGKKRGEQAGERSIG